MEHTGDNQGITQQNEANNMVYRTEETEDLNTQEKSR